MIDIDPRLASELRSKYARIKAESLPPALVNFDPGVRRPRRRVVLNRIVGVAGIAVVAAAIAAFGLELSGHLKGAPPTPAAHVPQPKLATIPVMGGSGLPLSAHVLVPVTHGRGSAILSSFTATGAVYIQYDCAGSGRFEIHATTTGFSSEVVPCSNSSSATTVAVYALDQGRPLVLSVVMSSPEAWEVLVAESAVPATFPSLTPVLPSSAFPLLITDTYAEGTASLPTFTPTETYWIQYACLGTGSIDILSSDGSVHYASDGCGSPGINGLFVPQDQTTGKPVSLRVETSASTAWELRAMQSAAPAPQPYEGAPPSPHPGYRLDFKVPAGATPLIPDTHGRGSITLPTFTPKTTYANIVLVCSGPGSLEITGSDGSTDTTESCTGDIGGSGGSIQPGIPLTLVIRADPATTWEILVYGVNVELPQP